MAIARLRLPEDCDSPSNFLMIGTPRDSHYGHLAILQYATQLTAASFRLHGPLEPQRAANLLWGRSRVLSLRNPALAASLTALRVDPHP